MKHRRFGWTKRVYCFLGVLLVVGLCTNHLSFQRAKGERDNEVFPPATIQTLLPGSTTVPPISAVATTRRRLRLNWANLPPQSNIATRLQNLQRNCSLPYKRYEWRKATNGMGSDIHVWGNHLWAGLLFSHRLKSPKPWIWADLDACKGNSSWTCYFPAVEPKCPNEVLRRGRKLAESCTKHRMWPKTHSIPEHRAAATEFLFSSVSQVVIQEAERQLQAVFGDLGVPANLITVHVRWGDKALEGSGRNKPIDNFISAVERIVREHDLDSAHVLLCTEDPKAEMAFRRAAPQSWSIYLDHFYTEYLPYRKHRMLVFHQPSLISISLKGKPGLWALGSLLVAMEANYYVLTTTSNWARVINELRKNVLNPRCGNCTTLIDLQEGEC